MVPTTFPNVDSLLDPEVLEDFLGDGPVRVVPLGLAGASGSRFYEVLAGHDDAATRLIVKETRLADHWLSVRTGDDRGREAAFLTTAELAPIHGIFALPHRAVAVEPGRMAILMNDVAPWLFDDADGAPITPEHEALLLDSLARMHAAFWESRKLSRLPWLPDAEAHLCVMGPRGLDTGYDAGAPTHELQDTVRAGWQEALERLPEPARTVIQWPARAILASWLELPVTLVHGDTALANFAPLPDGRLAAIDWALAGRAPCTCDVGRYLAVNGGRLTTSREELLATYRATLEGRRGGAIPDGAWDHLEEAGIVHGALSHLWALAAPRAGRRDHADPEWDWWENRLQRWAHRVV